MKLKLISKPKRLKPSRPARGAWIETHSQHIPLEDGVSRPARGAWIETRQLARIAVVAKSRPARGAWIETGDPLLIGAREPVAPRSGRVD